MWQCEKDVDIHVHRRLGCVCGGKHMPGARRVGSQARAIGLCERMPCGYGDGRGRQHVDLVGMMEDASAVGSA